jgi:hypothetical protein
LAVADQLRDGRIRRGVGSGGEANLTLPDVDFTSLQQIHALVLGPCGAKR